MIRALATGAEGLGFKTELVCEIFHNTPSVHPAVNRYPSLFGAGEGDGGG